MYRRVRKVWKLEVIVDVHQLKKQGFSISAIARKCNLSRTTVYEYLEMDYEEAFRWVDVLKTRKRKLDPYQDKILKWLNNTLSKNQSNHTMKCLLKIDSNFSLIMNMPTVRQTNSTA